MESVRVDRPEGWHAPYTHASVTPRGQDDPRPRWMICEPALFRLQKPNADPSRPFFSPLQAMDFDLFD